MGGLAGGGWWVVSGGCVGGWVAGVGWVSKEHGGNMKRPYVNKTNAKCFGNESQSLHSKG